MAFDVGAEELPDVVAGIGQVDVAAPDPLGVGPVHARVSEEAQQCGRLRIVDDDVVPLAVHEQCVLQHLLEVHLLHVGVPRHVGTLERVVHRLGDGEELVAAVDDLPLGVDPEALQERHVRGQQLGDAAPVRGGVDVQDPGAPKGLGESTDALDGLGPGDLFVVTQLLFQQRDALEHV